MSTRWILGSLVALVLGAVGCPGDDGTGDDDDSAAAPYVPDIPAGGCGAPEYDWLSSARMGEIVEWEEAEEFGLTADAINLLLENNGIGAFAPVPYDVEVYRVRYVTQDRGAAVETTGLLSFPVLDAPQSVPVVAWLHGTSGFTDECAPSAMGIEGALGNVLLSSLGYAVTAPDYLGMNGWGDPAGFVHPYVIAEPTAVASLDGVRALRRFHAEVASGWIDARPDARTVLWGGSEGGFAAFWAERYAPHYAPELDVVANVALVPPTDLLGLTTHGVTVFGATTGALAAALATMQQWYGETVPLDQVLTDEEPHYLASTLPELMMDGCDAGDLFDDVTTIEQIYQPSFIAAASTADWDAADPWSCYLRQGTLHDSAIPRDSTTPTLFVVSGEDDLVAADVCRADFPVLCGQGYEMEYLECEGASHTEGAVDSLPYQWQWVEDRLAGLPLEQSCVMTDPVDCAEFGLMD